MVDNIEKIKPYLQFDNEDTFYFIQIIKRKKENPELGSNSIVIKTYYIRNVEQLDRDYGEMKLLAQYNNARVCINLNKRSFKRIAFHTLRKITDIILAEDYNAVKQAYNSVCGMHSAETNNKKWIVDIDYKDYPNSEPPSYSKLKMLIDSLQPEGEKVLGKIPTKNGYHIISNPFNVQEFNRVFAIDIHKDNPTLLYIS